jgi:pyruvate dehydrogenase phosphatase
VSNTLPKRVADALSTAAKDEVAKAMQTAFTQLDREIVFDSVQQLMAEHGNSTMSVDENLKWRTKLLPAMAGCCALMAYINTTHNTITVACTGDSRAILARVNTAGKWQAIRLSQDQTGRNEEEKARMVQEHPKEVATVIMRGRVLGGLEPTRAFGDARYKWPANVTRFVQQTLFPERRGVPEHYHTPPYVTSQPLVQHHTIDPGQDKFLVLATDGLWDRLSDAQVADILTRCHTQVQSLQTGKSTPTNSEWSLIPDENAATTLVRNSLGGTDTEKIRILLEMTAPTSRRYRDDITVLVVWLGDGSITSTAYNANLRKQSAPSA